MALTTHQERARRLAEAAIHGALATRAVTGDAGKGRVFLGRVLPETPAERDWALFVKAVRR